jgi:putative intracellular protease/amidase
MEKNVFLFVCENMADWEPSLVTALISDRYNQVPKNRSYPVVTFGLTQKPVRTFGGLAILPDLPLDQVDITSAAMIILPGSSVYEESEPLELVPLIEEAVRNEVPVAAICGGTLFLARHGFLNAISHTSAGQKWLKQNAPGYSGGEHYIKAPCVRDGSIITANPCGFIEFAREITEFLDVFPQELSDMLFSRIKQGYLDADEFT